MCVVEVLSMVNKLLDETSRSKLHLKFLQDLLTYDEQFFFWRGSVFGVVYIYIRIDYIILWAENYNCFK